MHVVLPDGKRLDLHDGATGADVARAIGPGLARAALGIRVDGRLGDLLSEVADGSTVEILTARDDDVVQLMRHTLAHVLAHAVRDHLVAEGADANDVRMGIGPTIEHGFYYDFDLPRSLTPEDLEAIDSRMRSLIAADLPLRRYVLPRDEALARYRERGDPYKTELIEDLPEGEAISFYQQGAADGGGFTDLCRGPHVPSTGLLPAHFALTSLAGAYWRGDETRPMLQRVYGVAFTSADALELHVWRAEEAKRRDHRRLGAELDIFVLDEDVGPGLPLWLPRGAVMVEEIERLAKEVEDRGGYQRVRSPHLSKEQLFLKSGHLPYYEHDMFPAMELDDVRYFIKPMNCPFHHKIFAARPRSYRDLPLRLAEYGTCYRYEDHGALMGLLRVRSMQMNDAHIYCTQDQFEGEFLKVIGLYLEYFELFGIDEYVMRFSKHAPAGLGKKYVDEAELWHSTEEMVRRALVAGEVAFYEAEDEAAFYGPKIDVQIKSAIGREFTLATNQVDFVQPGRLGLEYVDEHGERTTPLCIHRAPLSTHERMIGFLIEHYGGDFPLWLAPEQARVVPIADRHVPYADEVVAALRAAGLRAEVDAGNERMNAKVRTAELYKVPYIAIVGDTEMGERTVSFRSRKEEARNGVALSAFTEHLRLQAAERVPIPVPIAS